MSTTALLHGLRIAQSLTTEAGDHGFEFSSVTVSRGTSIVVHLAWQGEREVLASHLLDTLGLDAYSAVDFPGTQGGRPFRSTEFVYRGLDVKMFGSVPAQVEVA